MVKLVDSMRKRKIKESAGFAKQLLKVNKTYALEELVSNKLISAVLK